MRARASKSKPSAGAAEHRTSCAIFLKRSFPSVAVASDADTTACEGVWIDSFAADPPNPMFVWIVKDERMSAEEQQRRFLAQLRYMLEHVARPLKQYGMTLVIRDDQHQVRAAAGLYVPGVLNAPDSLRNLLASGVPPVLFDARKWGFVGAKKLLSLSAVTKAKAELQADIGPVWYVQVVGVAPGQQGKGYGRQLMEAVCAFADEQNKPALLECETAWHETYYGRFGFETWRRLELAVKGCKETQPQYIMLRKPEGQAPAVEG